MNREEQINLDELTAEANSSNVCKNQKQQQSIVTSYLNKDMTNYDQAEESVEDLANLDQMMDEANSNKFQPYEEPSRIPHYNLQQFQFEAHKNDTMDERNFSNHMASIGKKLKPTTFWRPIIFDAMCKNAFIRRKPNPITNSTRNRFTFTQLNINLNNLIF